MAEKFHKDEVSRLHDNDIYIPDRKITLFDAISEYSALTTIKNLLVLDGKSDQGITMLLNSMGGCVFNGFAIYGAIERCESHVSICGMGSVMSMATVVMQAADERVLDKHAVFMVHYGSAAIFDNSQTVIKWAAHEETMNQKMEDIYLEKIREKHPKFTRAKLRQMLLVDTILSADEAVKLGLADKVV